MWIGALIWTETHASGWLSARVLWWRLELDGSISL